jgi:hypothetical protein
MLVSTTGLSRVFPERSGKNGLSICIMNVEMSLPGDIANSCNTITDGSDYRPLIGFTENNSPRPNKYGAGTCEALKVACAMLNAKNVVAYSHTPARCILRRTSDLEEKNRDGIAGGILWEWGNKSTQSRRCLTQPQPNRSPCLGPCRGNWELGGD